ncbi:hypothetical protein MTO96_050225, partial [Rhipicephalus appendiculatus]
MVDDPPADVRMLLVDLEGARGCISGNVIDYRMPCTATEDKTCQIVHHLPVWNEFLCCLRLELVELPESGRQLGLLRVPAHAFYTPQERLHQVTTLLYWLLKKHRCVASLLVTTIMTHRSFTETRRALLWRALEGNSSIKSLTFEDDLKLSQQHEGVYEKACLYKALLSLNCLEELEPRVVCRDESFEKVMETILRNTTELRVLNLFYTHVATGDGALLSALTANSTVRDLSLPAHMIAAHPSLFLVFMARNTTLERLSVLGESNSCGINTRNTLRVVFEGMLMNTAISSLEVKDCHLDSESASVGARMLRENKTLKILKFSSSKTAYLEHPTLLQVPDDVALLHNALSKNSTLEYLTLCFHIWSVDQWGPFFSVLSKHGSLKLVTVLVEERQHGLLSGAVKQLELSGSEDKVCFQAPCTIETLVVSRCKRCSSLNAHMPLVRHPLDWIPHNAHMPLVRHPLDWIQHNTTFYRVPELLPDLSHLTSLSVTLGWQHKAMSSAVATYIATTSTLRNLQLQYNASHLSGPNNLWSSLSQSLLLNTSITQLGIGDLGYPSAGLARLGDVVRQSVVVRRIHLLEWLQEALDLFIQRLHVHVSNYYTLCGATWRSQYSKSAGNAGW